MSSYPIYVSYIYTIESWYDDSTDPLDSQKFFSHPFTLSTDQEYFYSSDDNFPYVSLNLGNWTCSPSCPEGSPYPISYPQDILEETFHQRFYFMKVSAIGEGLYDGGSLGKPISDQVQDLIVGEVVSFDYYEYLDTSGNIVYQIRIWDN
ncbi:MAG: hypothetical protein Q4F57_02040 [Weeksellaceae bacterium]|nr:hypothetical protein [Weeksellaceae bacterium]